MQDCSWRVQNALQQLREREFLNMVSLLCYAGLQLESAKRLVTAARKVVFEHGVIVVLCRIAAGECKTPCNSCEKGSF